MSYMKPIKTSSKNREKNIKRLRIYLKKYQTLTKRCILPAKIHKISKI